MMTITPNELAVSDCLEYMAGLPSESVDLIVTSPPYNLRNSTGGGLRTKQGKWQNIALNNGYETHDDNMPRPEYVRWQQACLSEMMRLIKPTGAIFYNHKRRIQAGVIEDPQEIVQPFPVRQIIIWVRDGGINFNPSYFLPRHENIYLIAKPDFKLRKGANGLGDVWEISIHETATPDHPAPFPLALATRCIEATEAQLVFDPFVGRGTTAKAAQLLGRDFIGCDLSPNYIDIALKWLNQPETIGMFDHDPNTEYGT